MYKLQNNGGSKGNDARESAQEIAGRYGVSRRLILNWYYSGLIPAAVHIGRVLRFDPAEVDKALRDATK
jgi:predicted DNA-binding transcriptional regulator AlpA